MLSKFIGWLIEGATDTATYEGWLVVFGFVVTATAFVWAWLKGAGRPLLWYLAGALSALAAFAILTLVLILSGPKVLVGVLVVTGVSVEVVRFNMRRNARAARLEHVEKGLFDYWEQSQKAQSASTKALSGITKETVLIGKLVRAATPQLQALTDLPEDKKFRQGKRITGRLAHRIDASVLRLRASAIDLGGTTAQFRESIGGMLQWHRDNKGEQKVAEFVQSIASYRASVANTLETQVVFKAKVLGTPKMFRELTAANQNLADAVELTIQTMRETVAFCDSTLGRL